MAIAAVGPPVFIIMPEKTGLFTPNCIRLHSGIYFDPWNPQIDQINIDDIAHALSHQCRFGGHTKIFYSTARHSVLVAIKTRSLAGLLHDAHEAYFVDIPSPIKTRIPEIKIVEERLDGVIFEKFNVKNIDHAAIKKADREVLEWEWHNLVLNNSSNITSPQTDKLNFMIFFEMLSEKQAIENGPKKT